MLFFDCLASMEMEDLNTGRGGKKVRRKNERLKRLEWI